MKQIVRFLLISVKQPGISGQDLCKTDTKKLKSKLIVEPLGLSKCYSISVVMVMTDQYIAMFQLRPILIAIFQYIAIFIGTALTQTNTYCNIPIYCNRLLDQ